jgi:hypothetical protein
MGVCTMNASAVVARRANTTRELVYVLAASHSGSTLLAMLLGGHPDICTIGELKMVGMGNVDSYRCSCRSKIRECGFWRQIRAEMEQRGYPFDIASPDMDFGSRASRYARRLLRPLHRGWVLEGIRDVALSLSPSWRDSQRRVQARTVALLDSVQELTGKQIVVDSSKTAVRLKLLLRTPGLNVRVIRMVRDGREVALTYMDPKRFADAKDPMLRGGGNGGSGGCEPLSMESSVLEWKRSNQEAEAALGNVPPERVILVRYEDLCSDPNAVLGSVLQFLHVRSANLLESFRQAQQHVIGNGMRLDNFREVRLDRHWPKVLTAAQLRTFEEIAGELNQKLGYD